MDKYATVAGRIFEPEHLTKEALERRVRVFRAVATEMPEIVRRAGSYHASRAEMVGCNWCAKVMLDVLSDDRFPQ